MKKDRRKREWVSWNRFFCFTVVVVISCVIFTGFTFSTFRLFRESFRPVLISTWRSQKEEPMEAKLDGSDVVKPSLEIRETVIFPDQVVIFLKYPSPVPLFTKDDLDCTYAHPNSTEANLKLPPLRIENTHLDAQIVRCPTNPVGLRTSLALKSSGGDFLEGPTYRWDSLAYEAVVDRDNTTVVFIKGLNLRPERISDASRLECVYGWDFSKPRLLLASQAISAAQEIVRCETPLSLLNNGPHRSIKVSIRVKGRRGTTFNSVARSDYRLIHNPETRKKHEMCVCTMVRNQARFLREWVMYHARFGVQSWFIYDNNSDDGIENVIDSLDGLGYNITRYIWPWVKTQESGFAHCALRARESCEWIGFIDVDEFLHFPRPRVTLLDVLRNQTEETGELRIMCHSFGPSGLKRAPEQGVMVGYTCRLVSTERHKSIVRPEALNSSLVNVVHHFHVKDGIEYVNVDKSVMLINHYKYQVWDVFKEKFYRRVATYVADWQNEENVGSKDRAPGLGTRPVEPSDWSSRFCEVTDNGLRKRVLRHFTNRRTGRLPWQEHRLLNEQKYE